MTNFQDIIPDDDQAIEAIWTEPLDSAKLYQIFVDIIRGRRADDYAQWMAHVSEDIATPAGADQLAVAAETNKSLLQHVNAKQPEDDGAIRDLRQLLQNITELQVAVHIASLTGTVRCDMFAECVASVGERGSIQNVDDEFRKTALYCLTLRLTGSAADQFIERQAEGWPDPTSTAEKTMLEREALRKADKYRGKCYYRIQDELGERDIEIPDIWDQPRA